MVHRRSSSPHSRSYLTCFGTRFWAVLAFHTQWLVKDLPQDLASRGLKLVGNFSRGSTIFPLSGSFFCYRQICTMAPRGPVSGFAFLGECNCPLSCLPESTFCMFRFIPRFLLFYLSHYSDAHHNDDNTNLTTNTQSSASMDTHPSRRLLFLGFAMGSRSIARTKAPFLRFWIYRRSLLLLRLCHPLLRWEWEWRRNRGWQFRGVGGDWDDWDDWDDWGRVVFATVLWPPPTAACFFAEVRGFIGSREATWVWWVFYFSSLFYSRLKFYCSFLFLPSWFSHELTLLFFFLETALFAMVTSCRHFKCTPSPCIKSPSLLRFLGFYIRSHLVINL